MRELPSVLITGASTGIGATCARILDQLGYRVFAGVRKSSDGDRLRDGASERLQPILLDVTSAADIARAVESITAAVGDGGLSGVINNAGIAVGGPLEYIGADDLRRQFEVNVVGLHAVTVACLPLVRRSRGRIIHVGSIAGLIASPFAGPYSASKHAVEALADSLRLELAPEQIHVALIEPGQIRTPIWDKGRGEFATLKERMPEPGLARYQSRLNVLKWIVERAPRHASEPEQVAAAVLHALEAETPRTRYVVGRDARFRLWLTRLLPTRLMDAVVLHVLSRIERRLA